MEIIQISPKWKHIHEHNFAKYINSHVSRVHLCHGIEHGDLKYVLEALEINFVTAARSWLHQHSELNELS